MVRETEPLPLISEGPLSVKLPTKAETTVVTVTKPTIWQRIKAAVQKVKP